MKGISRSPTIRESVRFVSEVPGFLETGRGRIASPSGVPERRILAREFDHNRDDDSSQSEDMNFCFLTQ